MFNSRGIISRKGLLGSVWIAAHCLKRLTKKQVLETDIVTCVDTILHGEANEFTYWILAYLLLGVVRIYSKKVEFLKHDFAEMVHEANNFIAGKAIRSIKFHNSITIPETFELDAFNLDISEDQGVSRVHVGSREDITLADNSEGDICCKNDKYHGQEYSSSYEAFSLANTPVRDVCSPWFMDVDSETRSSYPVKILKSSMENLVGTRISLEKCLDQEMLGDIEKNPAFDLSSDFRCQTDEQQIMHHDVGILCEKSTNNESVQPITLDDAGKVCGLDIILDEGQTDAEQMNCPDAETSYQGPETTEVLVGNEQSVEKLCEFGYSAVDHLKLVIPDDVQNEAHSSMSSGEGHQVLGEHLKHPDASISFESREKRLPSKTSLRNQIQENSSLSNSVSVTPNSKITGVLGSAEFMAVHTPVSIQRDRVLRKKKCLVDDKIVISNKVLKNQINDSRDLVCKRKCAPLTALQAYKVQKICNLPKIFFEPLIPCVGVDFGALASQRNPMTRLSVETAEIPANPVILESPVTHMSAASAEASVNPVTAESTIAQMSLEASTPPLDPVHKESPTMQIPSKNAEAPGTPVLVESSTMHISHIQTPVAPTPFGHSISLRLHEVLGIPGCDKLESISSFNNIEKQKTLYKDRESDIGWMDEDPTSPMRSNAEKCEWSAETWRVATYLHQNISNLKQHKQKDNEFLNISEGLEKESRTVCAKLFYEILALTTGDYINVKQENAYGDILLQEKPKLKQTLDAYARTPPPPA